MYEDITKEVHSGRKSASSTGNSKGRKVGLTACIGKYEQQISDLYAEVGKLTTQLS